MEQYVGIWGDVFVLYYFVLYLFWCFGQFNYEFVVVFSGFNENVFWFIEFDNGVLGSWIILSDGDVCQDGNKKR